MLISLRVPQRTRPPPWNNIKLFHPPARTLPFSVTSLRTFTFKSFSRCPLHYSTTKTSLCGFLENLKNLFVPHPLLCFSSLPNLFFPRRVFARPLLILRCWCESRNFPRNSLNNSCPRISIMAALWKFARTKWIIRPSRFTFFQRRFYISIYYPGSLVCPSSWSKSGQSYRISAVALSITKLRKVRSISYLKIYLKIYLKVYLKI